MKAAIVTMTPQIAKMYLDKNKKNRKMSSRQHVYAEDMKKGRWKENGEAIIIDKNGLIKDGQHRLSATVMANHTWNVPVVSDVDPDVMDTIDTGKNRSLKDVLEIEGFEDAANIAAIAKSILLWNLGVHAPKQASSISHQQPNRSVTNKIGLDFVEKNRDMVKKLNSLSWSLYNKQSARVFGKSEIALFIYIITNGENLDNPLVLRFMNYVVGVNVDNNTAVSWFYQKMLKYSTSKERVSSVWRAAIFVKSWNLFISGNPPVTSLRHNLNDSFPKVDSVVGNLEFIND